MEGVAGVRERGGTTTDEIVECRKDMELKKAEKRRLVEKRGATTLGKRELATEAERSLCQSIASVND